jgi:hypothetical protein
MLFKSLLLTYPAIILLLLSCQLMKAAQPMHDDTGETNELLRYP